MKGRLVVFTLSLIALSLGIEVTANGEGDSPAQIGAWSGVMPAPIVPIHTIHLPTGKLLMWDRHDHRFGWDGTPRLFDPTSGQFSTLSPLPFDIFCAGHVLLPDGRVFLAGGHVEDFVGEDRAIIYNPFHNTWQELPRMRAGPRWYPTALLTASGSVAVFAGSKTKEVMNRIPEVWDGKAWTALPSAALGVFPAWPRFYPWSILSPNGLIFMAGPQRTSRFLNLSTGLWLNGPTSSYPFRDYGSYAIYEAGKGLMAGGANPPDLVPTASAEVIDLGAVSPRWQQTSPMAFPRRHLSLVALPDGSVGAFGGSSAAGFDSPAGAVLSPEIWNPQTGVWNTMAAATRYRGYHSVALLLPDGRVWVGGGGHPNPPGGTAETNYEIYSPPYLFRGERPVIAAVPDTVRYGTTFIVESEQYATITSVRLIRLGAVTHAFDQNQSALSCSFERRVGGLRVAAPVNPNVCLPGHYMLFILTSDGVPSVARFIQVQ